MVVEEPSVVAAASNAAQDGPRRRRLPRRGRRAGHDRPGPARATSPTRTGAVAALAAAATSVLARAARGRCPAWSRAAAGPSTSRRACSSRPGSPDGGMVVVHLLVDCRDAMGANLVNTVAEAVAERLAALAGGRVGLRILSNLAEHRWSRVRADVAARRARRRRAVRRRRRGRRRSSPPRASPSSIRTAPRPTTRAS